MNDDTMRRDVMDTLRAGGPAPDGRRLVELDRAESLRLLASVPLGRIVFTYKALPAIRPVNHVVDHGDVIVRSHLGAAAVSAACDRAVVAYEADAIDARHRLGWTVIVTGHAHLVTDPEQISRYQQLLRPWLDQPTMDHVLRIETELVAGFELVRVQPAHPDGVHGNEPGGS